MDSIDYPICFSNYFVNKQNVRSIQNVLNLKLLKSESEEQFLENILEDKLLVCEVPTELKCILIELRSNLRNHCKQDFKNYFIQGDDSRLGSKSYMKPVNKDEIFKGCWNAFYNLIPNNLCGNQQNLKTFKDMVRVVLYSMKNQHIFVAKLTCNWNLNIQPWSSLSTTKASHLLNKISCWLLKNILSAMLCLNFFVTTCKFDANENKLHFFWKSQWQSFYDKKISDMIFTKVISRFEPNCLGKKVKRKYSAQERLKLKAAKREIPKLHLVLKPNNNFRPIVRYKNDVMSSALKYKIKERLTLLRILNGKPQKSIETKFLSFHSVWVDHRKPKLYIVKTDLSNAFGSIQREKLMKILAEKNLDFQKSMQPLHLKKKYAQIYREMILELRKPLLVRAGSTVYEWREGLVQGYKYSPALSELYYTYMDNIYFTNFITQDDSKLNLFVRVVDDYLYITESLQDAELFITALSNYRNVNYGKTVVNFPHPTIKFSNDITFLGYSYTETLQVNRASYVYTGPMCYKITFSSAICNIEKFLENRIGQSGIKVNSHLFNFNHNSEDLIWKHIFLTFCLSANKFCTILSILCNGKEMHKYLDAYKKRVTVKLSNSIIETLMRTKAKDFLFVYCINHFRYLSFKALSLCAKETSRCSGLVPNINIELSKTNCIFGKFREHSSQIDKKGTAIRPAVKEVCRRTDLRKIVKEFDVLPTGFECYNYKKFFTQ